MTTELVRALIVQTSAEDEALIRRLLSFAEFEIDVWAARSGDECLKALAIERFDVVLCDYVRAVTDGLKLVDALRVIPGSPAIVLVTNSVDPELVAEAFRRGVNDYICTSKMTAQHLVQAVASAAHWSQETQRYQAQEELSQLLAVTDPMTGVYNRQYLAESLRAECSRARRYQRPLSVLMLDIDGLEVFARRHGQVVTNQAIRNVATSLKETCRLSDIVARLDDDFCVVMPETPQVGANLVADRILGAIASRTLQLEDGQLLDVSINMGLVTASSLLSTAIEHDTLDPDSIIRSADGMLRQAKFEGKRCAIGSYA